MFTDKFRTQIEKNFTNGSHLGNHEALTSSIQRTASQALLPEGYWYLVEVHWGEENLKPCWGIKRDSDKTGRARNYCTSSKHTQVKLCADRRLAHFFSFLFLKRALQVAEVGSRQGHYLYMASDCWMCNNPRGYWNW